MAVPFLNNIDLRDNQLLNAKVHVTSSAPSAEIGQIYLDSSTNVLKYHNGSTWVSLVASTGGTVTSITAGSGLSGGIITTSGTISHADTSSVIDLSASGRTYVTGLTFDTFGHVTGITTGTETVVDTDTTYSISATDGTNTANIVLTAGGSGSGTDSVTISGTANEVEVNASGDTITIGLPNDVTIAGNLTVIGTTTTNNVETVSTSNGVIFEGNAADGNELTLLAGTLTADRTVTLPNASGVVALTTDIPTEIQKGQYAVTISDTTTITHNLNSLDVIIQLYDIVTFETVFADVERISDTQATVTFASTPSNSIRVLAQKIGA